MEQPLQFTSQIHQTTYEKVGMLLRELFGEMVQPRPARTVFYLQYGSAVINVGVNPWGDNETTILVYCFVVTGADLRPDLLLHLLRKNDTMRFGAYTVDDANNICFQQAIVGSTVDKVQLKATVMAVAHTSDTSDDEIVSRWGGQRAIDR